MYQRWGRVALYEPELTANRELTAFNPSNWWLSTDPSGIGFWAAQETEAMVRWGNNDSPVLLDEIPAPKRTRRATYSVSPPSHFSQPVQQESEVETESEIMEEVFPISPPSPSSPAIQQVSELETEREVTRKAPPLSPPVPTADLESSTRQRHSTYTILERDSESTSSPKVTSGAVSDLMEV